MSTFVLVLVLMIATCGIAYWADNLGKNLGKKRVTLFNLRPRQTATLITMASSVAIMLLTLGVLLGTYPALRHALLRYDEVLHNNKRLTHENSNLNAAFKRLNANVQATQLRLQGTFVTLRVARANANIERANVSRAQSKERVALAGQRSAEAGQRAALAGQHRAEASRRAAVAKAREAEESVRKAGLQLATTRGRLTQTQARLSQIQMRLVEAQKHVAAATRTARNADLKAKDADFKLQRSRIRFLQASKMSLQEYQRTEWEKEQALVQKQQALSDAQAARDNLRDLQAQQKELQAAIEKAKVKAAGLQQVANRFAAGNIIASPDLVLAAQTVPAGASRAELEAALNVTLRAGSQAASQLGTPSQPVEGAELSPLLFEANGQQYQLPAEQIIPSLAQHLEGAPNPISLRLVPARFHIGGETKIETRFIYLPVVRAFAQGEILASTKVNPNEGDARLFDALQLLTEQGKQAAQARNVLPLLSLQGGFYSSGTFERLFEALRRVQSMAKSAGGGTASNSVEVRLVADTDLSTVDQLRVRFEVG